MENSQINIEMSESDLLKAKGLISDLKKTLCVISFTELKQRVRDLDRFVSEIKYSGKSGRHSYRKPFNNAEKQHIVELKNSGMNIYKIAQQMDRPYNSIKNYLHSKNGPGNI